MPEQNNPQIQEIINKQRQPKYFMIIVKDEGYTCPEERDFVTNELITPEEYLPPAANPEQWWNENSDFCGLCGGNTIIGIREISSTSSIKIILEDIELGHTETGVSIYKPVYLTAEEQKSIEEDTKNAIRQSQSR